MIVVDSSPIVAMLSQEVDAGEFAAVIEVEPRIVISAANKLEVMMVYGGRKGKVGIGVAQDLFDRYVIEVLPLTEALADLAADAFIRFGKGRHPARLNFGDCMAYALAKSLDAPLLFKGGDFALTDIRSAL